MGIAFSLRMAGCAIAALVGTGAVAQAQQMQRERPGVDAGRGQGGVFRHADANHDGMVSREEMRNALQARAAARGREARPGMTRRMDAAFAAADRNHDGGLSRAEARDARQGMRRARQERRTQRQQRGNDAPNLRR